MPCWWVGWWLWRVGCISQDTYLLYCLCYYCCFFHFGLLTGRRKGFPQRAAKHSRDPQVRSHISTYFFFISFNFIYLLYFFYKSFTFYSLAVVDCLYCGIILPCNAVRLLGCWYTYLLDFFSFKLPFMFKI